MKPIDTKTWKEFKVGDLFDVNSSKKIYHAINVTIIPTQEEGYYPYVVRQKSNNGIRGYIKEDIQTLNPANTITFAQDTAELFWQSQPYFTGNKVKVMTVKDKELTESLSLFLISTLKRAFSNFSYVTSYTVDNIKSVVIQLPVQPTLDPDKTYHPEGYVPDWDYMEAFMEQINQQAQARLNEYKEGKLEYTTLDTIGYTPVDTESWAEFKVGDLFEKLDLKCKKTDFQKNNDLSKIKTDEFNLPLVNAKQGNNGIMYYGREEDWEYAKMTIDIVSNGAVSAGNVYHQPDKTGVLYDAYLIKPLKKDITENHLIFLATVIESYVKHKYSYENKCIWKKLSLDKIQLPIDSTGQPDWDYMESFMKQINQQAQAKLSTLEKGSI